MAQQKRKNFLERKPTGNDRHRSGQRKDAEKAEKCPRAAQEAEAVKGRTRNTEEAEEDREVVPPPGEKDCVRFLSAFFFTRIDEEYHLTPWSRISEEAGEGRRSVNRPHCPTLVKASTTLSIGRKDQEEEEEHSHVTFGPGARPL